MISLFDPECHRQVSGIAAKRMKRGNGDREGDRKEERERGKEREKEEGRREEGRKKHSRTKEGQVLIL